MRRRGPRPIMAGMVPARGVRIGWSDLPAHVRAGIEAIVDGRVVEAVSQPGGFSPGTADRVQTIDGRRAFVKAVHPGLNEDTPELHRREARVAAALPDDVPAPRLLGVHDDGDWVALVLEDVEGRQPATPWLAPELSAVSTALDRLAAVRIPSTLEHLDATATELAESLAGFERLAADPPDGLDAWTRGHLDALVDLGSRAAAVLNGDSLVHTDVRADNLLLRPDGTAVLVDWPWTTRGAAWFDTLTLLVNVRLYGGHDVEALLGAHVEADPGDVTAVLAGLAGYFLDSARRPAPAGLPTVRAFQAAQGRTVVEWLRERLEAGD